MDFVLLLDALRHDYVTESETPFLFSLKQKAKVATVVETFAFQTRPAFFAGLEPDESGICHLYEFNPTRSPFAWLNPIIPILKTFDPWGKKVFGRGLIRRVAKQVEKRRGNFASADVMSCDRIPLHLLPYFSLAEKEYTDTQDVFSPHRTLFDFLRSHGKTWSWTGYPRHFGSTANILQTFAELPKADVAYLHFSILDWVGHKFGPDSTERRRTCAELDRQVSELLAKHGTSESRVIVFGDHGMVTVDHAVDLMTPLALLPIELGKDYVVFIDSTQARFWFFTDRGRSTVEAFLSDLPGIDILSDSDRATLGINQHRDKFGERIVAIQGNGIFHPSFFSHESSGPIGMHGYRPSVKDNQTQIFAYPNIYEDRGTIKMTEMFTFMLEHLGVR